MDIGKEVKEIEFEPVENPVREPELPSVPEPIVPAEEPAHAAVLR